MNIGIASERSGLRSKTIRYYEDIGLVRPARTGNGYRDYSVADIHRLLFLQRSRSLGFSVDECLQLLSLYHDRDRDSADAKAIAEAKVAEIDRKIAELAGLRHALHHLVEHCQGDERPELPDHRRAGRRRHGALRRGGAAGRWPAAHG